MPDIGKEIDRVLDDVGRGLNDAGFGPQSGKYG